MCYYDSSPFFTLEGGIGNPTKDHLSQVDDGPGSICLKLSNSPEVLIFLYTWNGLLCIVY